MARRVQELCAVVADEYGGGPSGSGRRRRTAPTSKAIGALPGFGEMKITGFGSVLALHFGVEAAQELVPEHPCLGRINSPEDLAEYQAAKRAHKAPRCGQTRAIGADGEARRRRPGGRRLRLTDRGRDAHRRWPAPR